MSRQTFSQRLGVLGADVEMLAREDVPAHARAAIVDFAIPYFSAEDLRKRLFNLILVVPAARPAMATSAVVAEMLEYLANAKWYEVLDFVEDVHGELLRSPDRSRSNEFRRKVNRYFEKHGVAWKLTETSLELRDAGELATLANEAAEALADATLMTASAEMRGALADLSHRPNADITGAVRHAMAALECVSRVAVGKQKLTLGQILSRERILPVPVTEAVEKLWGYASETARHGREGRTPTLDEAKLVVGVASAVATFIVSGLAKSTTTDSL